MENQLISSLQQSYRETINIITFLFTVEESLCKNPDFESKSDLGFASKSITLHSL